MQIIVRRIPGGTMFEAVVSTEHGSWPLRASSRWEDVATEGERAAKALGVECRNGDVDAAVGHAEGVATLAEVGDPEVARLRQALQDLVDDFEFLASDRTRPAAVSGVKAALRLLAKTRPA